MIFRGSGVALITPFKNNEVNYEKLEELIEWHIEKKTDAIIVCGTTGESATLSEPEKRNIFQTAVKTAGGRIKIIAGTGTNSTDITVRLSEIAEQCGVDGLLIVVPYYNKPTQRGLYYHYEKVASKVGIPIILYNVPSRTGVNLDPKTVYELSKIKKIVGIKEANSNINQAAEISKLCTPDFAIYSGNDDMTLPILSLGGVGVISVTANIIPEEVHNLVSEYFRNNHNNSLAIEEAMKELNRVLFIETNPIPVKTAMNLMGMEVGGFRLPLCDMEEENRKLLMQALINYGLKVVG